MSRSVIYTLFAVSLLLALFPLTLPKPGTPPTLKADEAAYVMMAQSLAHDADLRVEKQDIERIFAQFPYRQIDNVILMTDDGWQNVFYGKPYLYSLFAAPLTRLFAANGLLAFNMLLALSMVWMGTLYLRTFNADWLAALFSAGFFLASAGFSYVFWLQPEVFQMAAVTASLFLAFHWLPKVEGGRGWTVAALSGAALMFAAYGKPMVAAFALPILLALVRRRHWRRATAWVAGAVLSIAMVTGISAAMTGHPSPYLGVERLGVILCGPEVTPIEPQPAAGRIGPGTERPTGGAWSWIFRIPEIHPRELAENVGYFLWGRHTGLFLYFPFALIALLLFLATAGGRTAERWSLLAALAGIALFFLIFISHNWHGGGGFIGNRYFVNAYPGFLFLVTRLRGGKATLVGFAMASLFLGTLLLSPFGRSAPEPTLQSHARGLPLGYFPRELSLREIPGYRKMSIGDYAFSGRSDLILPRGDSLWLRGASRVEVWMIGERPLTTASFLLTGPPVANRIRLRMGSDEQRIELGPGEHRRVDLAPRKPDRVRRQNGATFYVYRLIVTPERGRPRDWTRYYPQAQCDNFPYQESTAETFFFGAGLTFMGVDGLAGGDPFAVRWGNFEIPTTVEAGAGVEFPVRLFNSSAVAWEAKGAARVKLSYHWLNEAGEVVIANGRRTELPLPLAAGKRATVKMQLTAPDQPGRYILELDPVFEHLAWFADKTGGHTRRAPVEVIPAKEPPPSTEGSVSSGSDAISD